MNDELVALGTIRGPSCCHALLNFKIGHHVTLYLRKYLSLLLLCVGEQILFFFGPSG